MKFVSRGENTAPILAVSIGISRAEKFISIYLEAVDQVGKVLRSKVEALLRARPDDDWTTFGRAIGRGASWVSEFKNGIRSTNDLRLVLKMAKFFSVPPDYLLTDASDASDDPERVMLLGAWKDLDARERKIVLRLAVSLSRAAPEELQ